MKRTAFLRKPQDAARLTVPVVKEAKRRTRKCAIKECRQPFQPRSMTHKVCSPACGMAFIELERHRKERKERQEGLAKLKRRADHIKDAQAAFNSFIRARDADQPCISCGRHHQGAYDAGHYRSVGAQPALRFDETNCHKQCVPCNQHMAGNAVEYRIRLVQKIGREAVELLEIEHEPTKYTIEDAQRIKAIYRAKLKALVGDRRPAANSRVVIVTDWRDLPDFPEDELNQSDAAR